MMLNLSNKSKKQLGGFYAGLFCAMAFLVQDALAAKDAAHGDGHGESSGGLPQFDISTFPSQLFWLAVAFAFLYLFFANKTLPDISSTIENRREQVESDLSTAEKLRAEAEQAQSDYETGLLSAREQASKTMVSTQQKISAKIEKSNNDFREKTEKEMAALEKRIHKAKSDAMEDMNTIAAEVAREAAEKIVGISTDLKDAKTVVKSLNGSNRKAA